MNIHTRPSVSPITKINRSQVLYNDSEDHFNVLKIKQGQQIKNNDMLKEHIFIPLRSTEVVQREDSGPWMHDTIIRQAVLSPHNHYSNSQAEACIKFVKQKTMEKCFETSTDINLALLQIRSKPIAPGSPSPATILFNRLIWGLLLKGNWSLVLYGYNEDRFNVLKIRQGKLIKNNDTLKEPTFTSMGSIVFVQREDGGLWMHGTVA